MPNAVSTWTGRSSGRQSIEVALDQRPSSNRPGWAASPCRGSERCNLGSHPRPTQGAPGPVTQWTRLIEGRTKKCLKECFSTKQLYAAATMLPKVSETLSWCHKMSDARCFSRPHKRQNGVGCGACEHESRRSGGQSEESCAPAAAALLWRRLLARRRLAAVH